MTEQTYTLCTSGHLVAILTRPSTPSAGGPAPMALLTNCRVISRVWPHRMNLHSARWLAAKGFDTRLLPALAPRQAGAAAATATESA